MLRLRYRTDSILKGVDIERIRNWTKLETFGADCVWFKKELKHLMVKFVKKKKLFCKRFCFSFHGQTTVLEIFLSFRYRIGLVRYRICSISKHCRRRNVYDHWHSYYRCFHKGAIFGPLTWYTVALFAHLGFLSKRFVWNLFQ